MANESDAHSDLVVVTATRTPEPLYTIPADLSAVTGAELLSRDATDLRTALSLVPGVEAPPGGDAGPSSSVPSFWGLHEFDAFLLVVDGVPWGGAFNPAISTMNLTDVKGIEVLKGAAPVMYGATSFVGVVQILHYAAGEAANDAEVSYGNFGAYRGAASFVLPSYDGFAQSLAISGGHLGFSDKREAVSEGTVLYRGALKLGNDTLWMDADVALVNDVPPSPVVRSGAQLNSITPLDANYQPADAKIAENKYHLTLGYSRPGTVIGDWETVVSFAHSDIRDVRGFLRPDLIDDGSTNADSQDQFRFINDMYIDSHLIDKWPSGVTLIFGADLLYGLGRQRSLNGEYYVPLNGLVVAPATTSLHVDEINSVADNRLFVGQYLQIDWKPDDRLDVIAGLRLNETIEHKNSSHIDGFDPALDEFDTHSRTSVRFAGTIGASYRAFEQGNDVVVLFADYRESFKPAALDFGPDNTPGVLLPETARSYEAGLKGALANGRLTYQFELFSQGFANLVVPNPLTGDLENAVAERLEGAEFEARHTISSSLSVAANIAYHDARFTKHTTVNDLGNLIDVAGNQLPLSPQILASVGILYTPPQGLNATIVGYYVDDRWLDEGNSVPASAYATVDATLGYRIGRYGLTLEGTNITDQRPVASASEFGRQSFYLLPGRTVWAKLDTAL